VAEEYDDLDLDRTTMRAWSRFQSTLADHVVAMEDDDVLVVDAETWLGEDAAGAAPYVQFCAWGDDLVRAEVSSNEYLDPGVALDLAGVEALAGLGWLEPTHAAAEEPDEGSANFYLDAARREGDRLAAMAVAALRDVFGVPHPAFLDWPEPQPPGCGAQESRAHEAPGGWRVDEPLAVMPESADHLRDLVVAALTPPGGPAIELDEDGDIPLPTGSALLFVRVNDEAPVVELFSFVVRGALDKERAAFEVAVLNRDTRMIKFVLLDDAVLATLHLPAAPFAPRNLRALVAAMAEVIDRVDDDLAARVGGRLGLDPGPEVVSVDDEGTDEDADRDDAEYEAAEEANLHPALMTLLQLDPDGEGVDPELAANVCGYDRDLVLSLLTKASEQEITWRKSADAALVADDTDEADVCSDQGRAWKATVETLRQALRVIVTRTRPVSGE